MPAARPEVTRARSGEILLEFWGSFDNLDPGSLSRPATTPHDRITRHLLDRYEATGDSFLDGLTGSFSVALRDPRNDIHILACDGMGNGYLAWAMCDGAPVAYPDDSTVLAAANLPDQYCADRLAEFFAVAELSGNATFFDAVKALLPGEMLIFQGARKRRRWLERPRLDLVTEHASWEHYVEEFAELLSASVRRSLAGLERVAVLMSGGLDSTPIAAFAARQLAAGGAAVTALSWRMSDSRADESALVLATAEKSGIGVEWIECDSATPFSDLANWPVHPSTPQQTAFRWFHHLSFARAAELGHRAILSGFCGDALYVGGRRWAWDLLSAGGPGRAIDELRAVAAEIGWRRTLRSHVFGPLLSRTRGVRRQLPSYLTASVRRDLAARPCWPPDLMSARRPRQAARVLALLDARGEYFERYYADRFGLDLRLPLRDFALVQFMLSVPDHLLQEGTETRPILRSAVRGLIPDAVRLRKGKAAFSEVLDRGMATANLRWAKSLLLDPDALWRGYIEESAVRSWIESSPTDTWGKIGYLHAIYGELWRRERAGLPRPSADAVD